MMAADADSHIRGDGDFDWAAIEALTVCRDLAFGGSRLATFELTLHAELPGTRDVEGASLTWSSNTGEVLGCHSEQVESSLRKLLAPILAVPAAVPFESDYELEQELRTPGGDERY